MSVIPVNIASPVQLYPNLSAESKEILQRIKKVHAGYFFKNDKILVNKLKTIAPVELSQVLNCFFMDLHKQGKLGDPVKTLDRLASLLPLDKMQKAAKENVGDALQEAKSLFHEAKYYLNTTQGSLSPSLRTRLAAILEKITSLLDNIVVGLGIGDFFKPAESSVHADFKSQKIMILLSLFSMLTAMLVPLLGAVAGTLVIGGSLLAISALSIIWPMVKPRPTHLPANAENWTKQIQAGGFVAQGRKESLDEIANILKMNRHALLVGPSRVGKSLTAKAFALAIARGDYPELRGKTVFRINVADLVDQKASFLGGGNTVLKEIAEAMGRHRNDIILVLDELHMACKNKEKVGDLLKTFLDQGGQFPHVIGITTEEELRHINENQAFANRFDKVAIQNTSADETLGILAEAVLKNRSKPLLDADALESIYDKSKQNANAPQPQAALRILEKCINLTGKTQTSATRKKVNDLSKKILSLRSQAAAKRDRNQATSKQIAELEKQLNELQNALKNEQKELTQLFQAKETLDITTAVTYRTALKVASFMPGRLTAKNQKELKQFILLRHFLSRFLEDHVRNRSKALGVKVVIDKALIEVA